MRKLVILFISTTLIVLTGCTPKDTTIDSPETIDTAVSKEEAMVQETPNEGDTSGDIPADMTLSSWASNVALSLVEFTALSITQEDRNGDDLSWSEDYCYRLVLKIDEVFILGSEEWPSEGEKIIVPNLLNLPLKVGQRYLTFIHPTGLDIRITAEVNEDKTISSIPRAAGQGICNFQEYNGYTVEQIVEISEEYHSRAKALEILREEVSEPSDLIILDDYTIKEPDSRALDVPPGDVAIDIVIGSDEVTLDDFASNEPAEPFIVVQEPDNRVFDVNPENIGDADNQSISRYAIAIVIGTFAIALLGIVFVVYKRKKSIE